MIYLQNARVEDFIRQRAKDIGYTGIRRDGNSTRAVDYYIQKLFENGVLYFKVPTEETMFGHKDDYSFAYDFPLEISNVQRYLFDSIMRRLQIEHQHLFHPIKRSYGDIENQIHVDKYRRIQLFEEGRYHTKSRRANSPNLPSKLEVVGGKNKEI